MHRRQFCLFCLALSALAPRRRSLYQNSFPHTFNIHVALCTLRSPLKDPSALPWIQTITSVDARIRLLEETRFFFFSFNIISQLSVLRNRNFTFSRTLTTQIEIKLPATGRCDYSGADRREGALQPKIGRHHCGIILQLGSILSEGTRILPFVI